MAALIAVAGPLQAQVACPAGGSITTAQVVALDQPFFYNRLGAINLHGMIYALRRDVVSTTTGLSEAEGGVLAAGQVMLRPDRRPRPLTLRVNEGDCLQIQFQNLLAPVRPWEDQPAMRTASVHVMGLEAVGTILSDGSNVGSNSEREPGPSGHNGVVAPGASAVYTLLAEHEGAYLMHNGAPQVGGEANSSGFAFGLFGQVNVEPERSEWYRSQLTREEMALATVTTVDEFGVATPVTTAGGQPVLDYDATYPVTHPRSGGVAGIPIIRMTTANGEIVHGDLNAVITGPNRGRLDAGLASCSEVYPRNDILEDRCEPFREFTIIFHDEVKAIQAFNDVFTDPVLKHTLASTRDAFAVNYGTGGIGAEILANRLGLGPMWNCNECKYEEFFLTSWAVGDPAMLVDEPAALDPTITGPKATKALYPDDPSNVFHSYLNDHVKIRNTHAGKEHHIFHLHGHQWLNTPNDDNSAYLDSQLIGPGSGFTYDIAYGGSGNRNKAPGDAIFHCHFYPHFAQGMWGMWRVHDSFEEGTVLNPDGTVATDIADWQARALPDGEIAAGVPTPAVVPLPGKAMAPMPTAELPGYPFYIPGVAGHRPPQPPMDFAKDANGKNIDGGLPRHVVIDDGIDISDGNPRRVAAVTDPASSGIAVAPPLNRLDFSKDNVELNVVNLPDEGTPLEQAAMAFHAQHQQASWSQDGNGAVASAAFLTNGMAPSWGAPYAAPCTYGDGQYAYDTRSVTYKGVGLQIDAAYTKNGWHFPQHRMMALNEDVADLLAGTKAPEPFFIRVNSGDCIRYEMTNLLPKEYDLDDFQVQTPTDVIGQHIHLVKFDVTAADGSANGYNYEDGTLSFEEVQERIHAINARGGIVTGVDPVAGEQRAHLEPEVHPYFGSVAPDLALGAQTTVQQWFADNVLNNDGEDRTLRTVFTHDHFAPSTMQQGGYYAGLIVEPTGSTWRDPETGVALGTRDDGGPTSWRADILTVDPADSYREFLFEFQDFTMGYYAGSNHAKRLFPTGTGDGLAFEGIADPANAINPPAREEVGLPFIQERSAECPGGVPLPCPEAISLDDPGFYSVNYRAEPVPLRVRDPQTNTQAAGVAGDLAHLFRSDVTRADPAANLDPSQWPLLPLSLDVRQGDPATPLMRVYEGDRVQIRTLVGAHEEGHNLSMNGIKWLYEPSMENSGWRNGQGMGISEHFEYIVPSWAAVKGGRPFEDYLFTPSSAIDPMWAGTWGLMRAYNELRTGNADKLLALPNNPDGKGGNIANPRDFQGVCPRVAPDKRFKIGAYLAADILPGGTLAYNAREGIHDPTAILYVDTKDIDKTTGKLKTTAEPLVLRVNAGDCINLTLENHLPAGVALPDLDGFSTAPMIVDDFNLNQVTQSADVGLHPQLVTGDAFDSDGNNVGFNPVQTAAPGSFVKYKWYAGDITDCSPFLDDERCVNADGTRKPDGTRVATPVEFGATGLIPADRIKGTQKGAIGSLIVEPRCATWATDASTQSAATVSVYPTAADGSCDYAAAPTETFREFSLAYQNDLNLRCAGCGSDPADANAIPNLAEAEDPEDSGQKAFNYRTEPLWARMGHAPDTPLEHTKNVDFTNALANAQVGGDPETPVFTAEVGTHVRFRLIQPGGHARNGVFTVYGHSWQQLPYADASTRIGDNPGSEVKGSQQGIGATSHFNILLDKAGGEGGVTGDYLYRDVPPFAFDGGLWGLLRVCPTGTGGNTGNTGCLASSN